MKRIAWLGVVLWVGFTMAAGVASAQSREDGIRLFNQAADLQENPKSRQELEQATHKYEQALQVFERLGDLKAVGLCANNLGMIYRGWGQYDRAKSFYEKALGIKGGLKDRPGEAISLNNLGNVCEDLGQYENAKAHFERSLAIFRELKDRKREGSVLNNLGNIYKHWSQYDTARTLFEQSLAIRKELKDRHGESQSLGSLGLIYDDLGQYGQAKTYFEQSLAIKRELKDRKGEGTTLNNLGNLYLEWQQYERACEYYAKSLAVSREFRDRKGETDALGNIANVYQYWGHYESAVSFYGKALAMRKELKDRKGEAHDSMSLARVHETLGQHDKAKALLECSLVISRELKDRKAEGFAHQNIGLVLQQCGAYAEARSSFQNAMGLWGEIKVSSRWPKALIADTYMDEGDLAGAERMLKEINSPDRWGRYFLLKADYSKAKEYYGKVLGPAEANRNADLLFIAYTGLGTACEGLKDDAKAAEYSEKAVKHIEDLRSSLAIPERETFFEARIGGFYRTAPYKGLARVLLRLNRPEEAFKSSEHTKARVFAESVGRMSEGKNLGAPPEVQKQDNELMNQLSALKKNLQQAYEKKSKLVIESVEPQVKELENKLQAHIKMLRQQYPLFAATRYPQPMNLSQTGLRDSEWVLAYDVTDTGVIIYLTKGRKLVKALFKTVPRKEVDELVRTFREPLDMDKTGITAEKLSSFDFVTGKKLSDLLLADVLPDLPKDTSVIIVPDDSLGALPFEMLVLNTGGKIVQGGKYPSTAGAEFFGDRNPISYYQSVTALTLMRQFTKHKGTGEKMLIMDDPVFRPDDPRYQKKARGERIAMLSSLDEDRLQSIQKEKNWNIKRLPRTGELGDHLAKLHASKADRYTGMEASKKVLFNKTLDGYGSVVFATHGCLDKDVPGIMEPALILTLVDQPEGQDGFLRMSEVIDRLTLNADVVALTACKSGLGHRVSGEGTMGMGRAFQHAGAKCVMMSLWSVAEGSSVRMTESFFKHLKDGKPRLEALKLARQEIRQAGYDHPFFWAPFILVGEVESDREVSAQATSQSIEPTPDEAAVGRGKSRNQDVESRQPPKGIAKPRLAEPPTNTITAAVRPGSAGSYRESIVAVVNGDVVLASDVEKYRSVWRSLAGFLRATVIPAQSSGEKGIVDELILLRLLEQKAARKSGFADSEDVDRFMRNAFECNGMNQQQVSLLLESREIGASEHRSFMQRLFKIQKYITTEVTDKIVLTERDVQAYFKENRDRIEHQYQDIAGDCVPVLKPKISPANEPSLLSADEKTNYDRSRAQVISIMTAQKTRSVMKELTERMRKESVIELKM